MLDLRMVEVGIHNYCNRKCSWCPLSYLHDSYYEMPEKRYLKLLTSLAELQFKGAISYSRYCEPLAKFDLLVKRIEQARDILPNCRLVFNTNGDMLSTQKIAQLKIDELTIMDYDNLGLGMCLAKFKQWGVTLDKITYPYIYGHYQDMQVLYYVDWPQNALIEDRGGILNQQMTSKLCFKNNLIPRSRPCNEPRFFVGVEPNGDIMPCCNITNRYVAHHQYSIGNLKAKSLKSILESSNRKEFIKGCSKNKIDFEPCLKCHKESGRYTSEKANINYIKFNSVNTAVLGSDV